MSRRRLSAVPAKVSPSGTILLGTTVACDGFHRDYAVRVQTHLHLDHMEAFETSLGLQDILLTQPTRHLLIADMNGVIPIRQNIKVLELGVKYEVEGSKVALYSSGHMLGAVQVQVTLPDGRRVGYSGDFNWPLDHVIEVDVLVVDSTYGHPSRRREYSQNDAEESLLRLVLKGVKSGPVAIYAHRGTLQRCLQVLSCNVDAPFVCSSRILKEAEVYRQFGYAIDPLVDISTADGRRIVQEGRYVHFYGKGDRRPIDVTQGIAISLSAYMARSDDPVLEFSERAFRVALTDHADFEGTLQYVHATGATTVLTDNTRGGHAVELASELRRQLGVDARPSLIDSSHEWGT